jgi:hypothetical protein
MEKIIEYVNKIDFIKVVHSNDEEISFYYNIDENKDLLFYILKGREGYIIEVSLREEVIIGGKKRKVVTHSEQELHRTVSGIKRVIENKLSLY